MKAERWFAIMIVAMFLEVGAHSRQPPVESETWFQGKIDYVQQRSQYGFRDPAAPQFLVMSVERSLCGAKAPEKIVVGVRLDAQSPYVRTKRGIDELNPKYFHAGSRVILLAKPSDPSLRETHCFPFGEGLDFENLDAGSWSREMAWVDDVLQALRPIPVFCASVDDTFVLDE